MFLFLSLSPLFLSLSKNKFKFFFKKATPIPLEKILMKVRKPSLSFTALKKKRSRSS